jgi:tetratricopeptide (TPR) repeat protein
MLASTADPPSQEICQSHFERALSALPNYPRAVNQYATFLTDMGNQRLALTQLESALRSFPDSIHLQAALAYAARTSGLLEVAVRAAEKRLRLQGGLRAGRGVAENVFLYRGELEQFEQSLGTHRPGHQEVLLDFYRGYCSLLKGDNPAALAQFRQSAAAGGSRLLFEALSEVFALGLEGREELALERLNHLRNQRLRLRVPDGEFTFKVAEAYALLGRVEESLDVAERAFSQGFGCTPWYENSPLLAPIRTLPRWPSLLQHLRERQHLLESRFSPSRFT